MVAEIESMEKGEQRPPDPDEFLDLTVISVDGSASKRLVARGIVDVVFARIDENKYRSTTPVFRSGTYAVCEV